MVLYHWHRKELFEYFDRRGCVIINDDYPDVTILRGPSNHLVVVKHKQSYYHPVILRYCEDLGIRAPKEFIKIKKQFDDLRKACEKNPFLSSEDTKT